MSLFDRLLRIVRAEMSWTDASGDDNAQHTEKIDSAARTPPRGSRVAPGVPTTADTLDPSLARHFVVLELPVGTAWPEVKSQYKRLMRLYHPDQHSSHPDRYLAATQLTQRITESYLVLKNKLSAP